MPPQAEQVDYDALAQKNGASPALDYDALARRHGAQPEAAASAVEPAWKKNPVIRYFNAVGSSIIDAPGAIKHAFTDPARADEDTKAPRAILGLERLSGEPIANAIQDYAHGKVSWQGAKSVLPEALGQGTGGAIMARAIPVVKGNLLPESEGLRAVQNGEPQARALLRSELEGPYPPRAPFPRIAEGLPEVEEGQAAATEHLRNAVQPRPIPIPARLALTPQRLPGEVAPEMVRPRAFSPYAPASPIPTRPGLMLKGDVSQPIEASGNTDPIAPERSIGSGESLPRTLPGESALRQVLTGQNNANLLKIARSRGINVSSEAQLKPGVADAKLINKIVDDFSPDELDDFRNTYLEATRHKPILGNIGPEAHQTRALQQFFPQLKVPKTAINRTQAAIMKARPAPAIQIGNSALSSPAIDPDAVAAIAREHLYDSLKFTSKKDLARLKEARGLGYAIGGNLKAIDEIADSLNPTESAKIAEQVSERQGLGRLIDKSKRRARLRGQ